MVWLYRTTTKQSATQESNNQTRCDTREKQTRCDTREKQLNKVRQSATEESNNQTRWCDSIEQQPNKVLLKRATIKQGVTLLKRATIKQGVTNNKQGATQESNNQTNGVTQ